MKRDRLLDFAIACFVIAATIVATIRAPTVVGGHFRQMERYMAEAAER